MPALYVCSACRQKQEKQRLPPRPLHAIPGNKIKDSSDNSFKKLQPAYVCEVCDGPVWHLAKQTHQLQA